MEKLVESHVHTVYCGHAEAEAWEMAETAIKKGVNNIGFSDHFHLPLLERENVLSMKKESFKQYTKAVKRVIDHFGGQIEIRYGAEVDFLSGFEDEIREEIQEYDFDYTLGSVHYLGKPLRYLDQFDQSEAENVIREYLEATKNAIKACLFNVLAHPELIKYFYEFDEQKYMKDLQEITDLAVEYGMALEINVSHVDVTDHDSIVESLNPGVEFLKLAIKKKIPLVIGGDAHRTEKIAYNFDKIIPVLKESGVEKLSYYEKKNRIDYKI